MEFASFSGLFFSVLLHSSNMHVYLRGLLFHDDMCFVYSTMHFIPSGKYDSDPDWCVMQPVVVFSVLCVILVCFWQLACMYLCF